MFDVIYTFSLECSVLKHKVEKNRKAKVFKSKCGRGADGYGEKTLLCLKPVMDKGR